MSDLTEREIFDCLATNFKLAAEHCDDLAKLPRKGPTYLKLREELRLLEGACRQAAYWRGGDARWLSLAWCMDQALKRAGSWLRGYKLPDGTHVTHREGTLHPLFTKLAVNLRGGQAASEYLRTARTGVSGPILPKPITTHHERRTPSGLIIPAGMAA